MQEETIVSQTYGVISETTAAKLSNIKTYCSHILHKQLDLFQPDYTISDNVMGKKAMHCEMRQMEENPKNEPKTYGFMNTLLSKFFCDPDLFIVAPQSNDTRGLVDFLVRKGGDTFVIIECKAKDNYSLTDLYSQSIAYAIENKHQTNVYVIVHKGANISFGMYVEDFHSSNRFLKRNILFDGYIGLHAVGNTVYPLPQENTIYPQHKVYTMNASSSENNKIYTILRHMSSPGTQPDPSHYN